MCALKMPCVPSACVALFALAGCQSLDPAPPVTAEPVSAKAATSTQAGASTSAVFLPGVDCRLPANAAQTLACRDAELGVLDREVDRVATRIIEGMDAIANRAAFVRSMETFEVERDACAKGDGLRQCVVSAYVGQIHRLRQEFSDARREDAAGISEGPTAWVCEGAEGALAVTFVRTPTGFIFLQQGAFSHLLYTTHAASGVKYIGHHREGEVMFWTKSDEALFSRPGQVEHTRCRQQDSAG